MFTVGASDKSEGTLMPSPKEDMEIPLLNFDLPTTMKEIFEQLSAAPSKTTKHVFGTVRGQGGGKSRILEEIRRELLGIDHILPIAITCNSGSGLINKEKDWKDKKQLDVDTSYAMSIIARILFATYEFEEFSIVCSKITENLSSLPKILPTAMIRAIITLVAKDVSVVRKEITDVVVILDESLVLADHYVEDSDIHNLLRIAMLNDQIGKLRCTLLMSSLKISQIGYTQSGRGVTVLPLPENLNEDQIVDKIFNIHGIVLTKKDRLKLKRIASLVSNLPRVLQFTNDFISKHSLTSIDAVFVKKWFLKLLSDIQSRYHKALLPSVEIMHKLVYNMEIPLNNATKELIVHSILTNRLDEFAVDPLPIQPKVSLPVLISAALKKPENIFSSYIKKTFSIAIDSIGNSDKEGDILEGFFPVWMQFRLQCSYEWGLLNNDEELTIAQLFGSLRLLSLGGIWKHKIEFPFDFDAFDILTTMNIRSFIHPLNESSEAFPAYFEGWFDQLVSMADDVSIAVPLRLIKLAEGERADYCLVIYRGEDVKPFYIFIELKSMRISEDEISSSSDLKDKDQSDYFIRNLGKHLNKNDFSYVYFSTRNLNNKLLKNGAIVLGKKTAQSFFSIIWPLYLSGRASNEKLDQL